MDQLKSASDEIEAGRLKKTLGALKQVAWDGASVSLFVVKRKLVEHKAHYDTLEIAIEETLAKRLRHIITKKIGESRSARKYDFVTSDPDNELLGVWSVDTDFQHILDVLQGADGPPRASSPDQLTGSWMYIVRLDVEDQPPLFFARLLSRGWNVKKVKQLINMIFKNTMLVDVKDQEMFRIDLKVDFFVYDDITFIANKKNFETALNFRIGMIRNRDEIVAEFKALALFPDASVISSLVGDHLRLLRKLSQVKKAGYYKDKTFLERLRKVSDEEDWGIEFSPDGKIIVNEGNIELVLRVLNNDRLTSKITDESFDVDVKHKLDTKG